MMLRGAITASLLAFAPAAAASLRIEPLASPVAVRLRGLSAVNDQVAWASGQDGTVLRTVDGGSTWRVMHVPGASALDFRDVHAFGADAAVVMAAGPDDASRVYRTADAGATWTLVLRNLDSTGFFDCLDFQGSEGRLLGDPVNGRFQLFASSDQGRSWHREQGPRARKGEAAFAASGTCVRRVTDGTVVVTGGTVARMHFLPDRFRGRHEWRALAVQADAPGPSAGLFSVAPASAGWTISVGGDYRREGEPSPAFGAYVAADAATSGRVWHEGAAVHLARGDDINTLELRHVRMQDAWSGAAFSQLQFFRGAPGGYRSAVACGAGAALFCIATGPSGTDVLRETPTGGARPRPAGLDVPEFVGLGEFAAWQPGSSEGYDSVAIAGRIAWFSGAEGKLGRAELPP